MNILVTVRQQFGMQTRTLCSLFMLAFGLLMLGGCASTRVIESQVQTTPQWTTAAPNKAFYRWDRLPADAHNPQAGWAETILESALAPLGWTRNDVEAQYSVWVGVRTADYMVDSWGRPLYGPWTNQIRVSTGIGVGTGYRSHGVGVGVGIGMPLYRHNGFPPAYGYAQEVSIIIRDLNTSNVVYQTKATHESPWSDHNNILKTMIPAALQGFPNPPALNRRVDTTIAR